MSTKEKTKRKHDYPKTRKPRDTGYAESTKLANKHGLARIRQLWEQRGPTKAAKILNTRPTIIRFLAQKWGWVRAADYCPNILKAVMRGNASIHDYDTLTFQPEMVELDPDRNKDFKYTRECNPHAIWIYKGDHTPTTYQWLPELEEEDIPCIRRDIQFAGRNVFLVCEPLPDLKSRGYWYLSGMPQHVFYFDDMKPYKITWKQFKQGNVTHEQIDMIQKIAKGFCVNEKQAVEFIKQHIDPRIKKLNQRIKKALNRTEEVLNSLPDL